MYNVRSGRLDSLYASGSSGLHLLSNSGTVIADFGAGGGSQAVFRGFAGYNSNVAANYTARSFTDKNYVDSALGTVGSGGSALSSITAATSTNTINNANYSQNWQWNSFSNTSTPFKISGTIGSTLDGAYNNLLSVESSGAHNASAGSRKIANISSVAIGTSTTTGENIALYLKAARATNNNYALIVDSMLPEPGFLAAFFNYVVHQQ
jgi:hypothetical protein